SNNKIVASNILTQKAKKSEVESSQNAYYPTLDIGAFYKRDDDATPFQAGDTYSAYAKVGVDLYDGGRKSNTIKQNIAVLKSSKYDASAYKKSLQLQIVQDFYSIESAKSTLEALQEKDKQLLASLERVKKFYAVGSATKDDVERLKAAYSNNSYKISSMKYQITSLKKLLSIKVGKKIDILDNSSIKKPQDIKTEYSDAILALQANASSLAFSADSLNANYYPQLRLEDTYSVYDYDRENPLVTSLDNQNVLMLTLNMRLYDNGTISKQKEALLMQKDALSKKVEQLKDEQNINVELSLLKIETVKAQIQSAKSSLTSSVSAFETVSEKYKAGLVDYVTYLDALSIKTLAKAQYETALNDLQIAYATYYYNTNKNIKDFIK
ncbi:MAG: TolC family protein, partial [Campylobacterales bacterium]